MSHWRDLGDYIYPRRPRFQVNDVNKGDRRNQKIVDSTATTAARTLRSGMMSGITSPARPWFRLTTPDLSLGEYGPVKDWLYLVTERMSAVFLKSNIYNVLPIVYGDIGSFGTAAMIIEEDLDSVIRCTPFAIGSYYLSNNSKLKVDTFMRDFRLTVRQCLEKFGETNTAGEIVNWQNFSLSIRNAYDTKQLEQWVDLCHVIKPNENFNPNMLHSKFKKFSSCYYERGTASQTGGQPQGGGPADNVYLRESGYDYFPVLAPRWEVTGEDVYGTDCPGMTALGDIKQLQLGEKRAMQAIEKMINPSLVGPSALRNQKVSLLPGDITFEDSRDGQKGLRSIHDVNFRLDHLDTRQNMCRDRIRRVFYEDLFLALTNDQRSGITAREIDEKHEEKLLALGPVLEQLNQDLLDPTIDIVFDMMLRQDLLPPPPEELHGQPLKVEYTSVMAQAQKLLGIAGVERYIGIATQVAQVDPNSVQKTDWNHLLEVYGGQASLPPSIVRTDDEVQQIRDSMAKQQQQQQAMEALQQGAQTAQTLSQTDTGGDNALTELMQQGQAGAIAPTQ